ncbi:MAG TPA: ABC transporter permease, partial [Vicinamibacterales bacterium]|nr:ABC transporter permease [Vicinamibacterales bacterium]
MWKRFNALFRHDDLDRGLNAEVRFHIEMETDKNIRLGMSPEEARLRAHRSFGPMEKHKEETRDARGVSWLETLMADLRYGSRALLKHPGYTLLAVLTLGLGIGANTAIFSVINGVLLKPLPYEHGDRLVVLQQSAPLSGRRNSGIAIAEYFDYRSRADVFDGLVEYHQMNFDLINRGEPDRVDTGVVSHNFFDLLGIKPIYGRTFMQSDDVKGAEAVLILSYTYWQTKFGGDPNIIGQVFEMNDRPHRVIGVLPNVPHYPQENDVYMPVLACPFRAQAENNIARNRRAFGGLNVFGRLKPGVSPEQAASAVGAICHTFTTDKQFAQVYRPEQSGFQATTVEVRDALTSGARDMLLILLGITAMILLIACANVANLTLARMLGRDRELAMRAALGAGRSRLVRQLLTESTVLAVCGGIVGVLFAYGTIGMLTRFVGRFTSRTGEIEIDLIVLLFTLGVSVVTGVLFGTLPALGSRVDLVAALKQGGGQAGNSSGRKRMQGALIVAQVAVSVVLLVGAGLLLASFYRLQQVETGYRSQGVLAAQVYGNFSKYPNVSALRQLYLPMIDRLQSQPGVTSVAITNAVPLAGGAPGTTRFDIEGRVTDDPERRPTTDTRIASSKYFETIGIPLVSGRAFNDLDTEESYKVIVINKSMAKYWDGTDPVGTKISPDRGETWFTVVGVVGDVRQFGLAQETVAQLYIPLTQTQQGFAGQVLVRTAGDPISFANTLRNTVHLVDSTLPVEEIHTLDDLRSEALAAPRLTATLLAVFAALALLVTLAGIGGVIATSVQQRTKEFGLRMALGAGRDSVLTMVIRQGLTLVAIGLLFGVAGALAAGRVLSAYLYQTAPR